MAKKTIDQVDVAGKRVLMRVDFNVPLDGGRITDDRRIRAAMPSIQSVLERGGGVVLMSHLGRPKGSGFEEGQSLRPCAERLSELLGKDVRVPSNDCVDGESKAAVEGLDTGEVLLLENLRFHKGEKEGDPSFASKLAAYGDIYCNDAFGASHRADASMVAVPKAMSDRPRVVGLLLKKEIDFLSGRLESPKTPYVAVLGGAKISDKIPVVERLIEKTDAILIGGAMAYTFLTAQGRQMGESKVERDKVADCKRMLELAARESCELHLPVDHICSTEFSERSGDIETFDEDIQPGFMGLDIGPKTQSTYARVISKAKTIVWNGPMGVFEMRPFAIGTRQIAEAIAEATEKGALSVVGGGDSAAAIEKYGFADRITHVSTGGGASLEMLAGHEFESVGVLDDA